jgi:hypothetical protein
MMRVDGWLAYTNEPKLKAATTAFNTTTMLAACDAAAWLYVGLLSDKQLKREKRITITVSRGVILPGETEVTDRHDDIRWYDYIYHNGVLKRQMGFTYVAVTSS